MEEKTKVQAEFYAVGLGVLFLLMLFSGFGADIICHITAFAFPFYETIKSLEQNNVDGQSSWLKYWGETFDLKQHLLFSVYSTFTFAFCSGVWIFGGD